MIDLSQCAALFADTARHGISDENIIFITAYPKTAKPTMLKSAVAAFSVYDTESEQEGLGSDMQSGQIKMQVSVYVPYKCKNQNGNALLEKICRVICSEFCILSIKIAETEPDADTECMVARAVFTLDDEILRGDQFESF